MLYINNASKNLFNKNGNKFYILCYLCNVQTIEYKILDTY
jgi:hypothetical protein